MVEITVIEEEKVYLPSYSKKGDVLVHVIPNDDKSEYFNKPKFIYEVIDYDEDSGLHWIAEEEGFHYWFEEEGFDYLFESDYDLPKEGGYFVVKGISGYYIRGEWGFTEDTIDWSYDDIIPATNDQVKSGSLLPIPSGNLMSISNCFHDSAMLTHHIHMKRYYASLCRRSDTYHVDVMNMNLFSSNFLFRMLAYHIDREFHYMKELQYPKFMWNKPLHDAAF